MRMIIIISLFLFILTGCSNLRVITTPTQKPLLEIEDPDPLELRDIEFYIITRDNTDEVLSELENSGLKPVIIGLSGMGYKILSLNIDKIKNYIILQNEIIKRYRDYYEGGGK